ncbi:MAG TPA: hypothetical protein VF796_24545 [Humisphaera sp.]
MRTFIDRLEGRTLFSSAHYVVDPTFVDNGTTLTASGSIAGLGNEDVTVTLTATGTATILGVNPAGKVAPGQSQSVTVLGSQVITDPKNGRVDFSVTTIAPTAPTAAEAGLPNAKWTAVVTDVQFSTATITVQQGGETVLTSTSAV